MESGQSDAVTVTQPDTPCQAQMPSARYGQVASQLWSCRQITGLGLSGTHESLFIRHSQTGLDYQAVMAYVGGQTWSSVRHSLSATHEIGQNNAVALESIPRLRLPASFWAEPWLGAGTH